MIGEKKDFDFSKYQICFGVCGEKSGFWRKKNSSLCCDDKKMIFNDRKIRSVFIVKKKMKKIFLRKEFHSQYEFMQS